MSLAAYLDVSEQKLWDAARLAVQSAVAAATLFVVMQAFGWPEKFVGILSAVLVIQPSVGNTIVEAGDRILATITGSIIGIACLFAIPIGYGTAAALAITMLAINAVAGVRPDWRYGVVAGVALALGSDNNALETAQDRALAIGLGALTGVLVALVVWPDKASKRTGRHLKSALMSTADLVDALLDFSNDGRRADLSETHQAFQESIGAARKALSGVQLADSQALSRRIDCLQRLYHAIVGLERVHAVHQKVDVAPNEGLQDLADEFRDACRDVLRSLAEDGDVSDDRMQQLDDNIDKVRSLPRVDEQLESLIDNALAFALTEVKLALENLRRAFDSDHDGSFLDWPANASEAATKTVSSVVGLGRVD